MPSWTDTLNAISAFSTAAAAIFSAYSAMIARKSAQASLDAVEEAKQARLASLAPKLVFEKEFLDLTVRWPHPKSLNGEPVLLGRQGWRDPHTSTATFALTNFGQSPALEMAVDFELSDIKSEIVLTDEVKALGLAFVDYPSTHGLVRALEFPLPNGSLATSLTNKWTVKIPNCAPGQKRTIEFPDQLSLILFAQGAGTSPSAAHNHPPVILTVRLRCFSMDGREHRTQFRFKLSAPNADVQDSKVGMFMAVDELPMQSSGHA